MASLLGDGITAYQRGDYLTASRLLEQLAKRGNASAQFNLGVMFRRWPRAFRKDVRSSGEVLSQGGPSMAMRRLK